MEGRRWSTAHAHNRPLLLLVLLLVVCVSTEDCPCSWRDDNRSWDCAKDDLTYIPTQCWPLQEKVDKITFNSDIIEVKSGDFEHENLHSMTILHLQRPRKIAQDALLSLSRTIYLDLSWSNLTEVPDLSTMTDMIWLELAHNHLTAAPELIHMTKNFGTLGINHNLIEYVPDNFLPESEGTIGMSMVHNNFKELNATSIVRAAAKSSFTFDQLNYFWATKAENETIVAKEFYCNIDLQSITHLTDDPTGP